MKRALFIFLFSFHVVAAEPPSCGKGKAEWMKCKGELPKEKTGTKIKIHSLAPSKEACYSWVGEAEYSCQNGHWTLEKKGQSCNWDCICCY